MELRDSIHRVLLRWSAAPRTSRLASATLISVIVAGLVSHHVPWRPTPVAAHRSMSIWDRHDSAAYVVSTLNLVHCRGGHPLTTVLVHRYPVARYDVYADQQDNTLFFIEPKRGDGKPVGALAYQLGWTAPMSVSTSVSSLYVRPAPADAYAAFRNDPKQLIGSFSSTVPS